jgi:hypothetical protein
VCQDRIQLSGHLLQLTFGELLLEEDLVPQHLDLVAEFFDLLVVVLLPLLEEVHQLVVVVREVQDNVQRMALRRLQGHISWCWLVRAAFTRLKVDEPALSTRPAFLHDRPTLPALDLLAEPFCGDTEEPRRLFEWEGAGSDQLMAIRA